MVEDLRLFVVGQCWFWLAGGVVGVGDGELTGAARKEVSGDGERMFTLPP